MPQRYPLHFLGGHVFIELAGLRWLMDTGAPASFGDTPALSIDGRNFTVAPGLYGVDAAQVTRLVGVPAAGLLGADVLGEFDFILDADGGTVEISTGRLELLGNTVAFESLLGLPVLTVHLDGANHRVIFDTGAQLSYLHTDGLEAYPSAGRAQDFYPGFGVFETDTRDVTMAIGSLSYTLRCGTLPLPLQSMLSLTGAAGAVGSQLLAGRKVGYFPRRRRLVLDS
ncbi:MAG TPA: hypothetical protein VFL95_04595 [Gemmatimonadales bacterium]|nr:hypothetical protein [Gemmatimonadales bacterium]